jgi:AcrR family transcriptional regulator
LFRPAGKAGGAVARRLSRGGKNGEARVSKEAIVRIASRLFQERGYNATSLAGVSEELGVTRPALYHYFRSKQDLLYEIHRLAQTRLVDGSAKIYALDLEPVELIRRLLHNHAITIVENAELVACFFHEESNLATRRRNEIRKVRSEYTNSFAKVYESGVKRGEFVDVDPKLAAFLMLGSCNWIVNWYRSGTWPPEQVAHTVSSMLVDGMLAPRLAGTRRS